MKSLSPFSSKMQNLASVVVVPWGILASPSTLQPSAPPAPVCSQTSYRRVKCCCGSLVVLPPVWILRVWFKLQPTSDTAVLLPLGLLQKLLASLGKLPSVNIWIFKPHAK